MSIQQTPNPKPQSSFLPEFLYGDGLFEQEHPGFLRRLLAGIVGGSAGFLMSISVKMHLSDYLIAPPGEELFVVGVIGLLGLVLGYFVFSYVPIVRLGAMFFLCLLVSMIFSQREIKRDLSPELYAPAKPFEATTKK